MLRAQKADLSRAKEADSRLRRENEALIADFDLQPLLEHLQEYARVVSDSTDGETCALEAPATAVACGSSVSPVPLYGDPSVVLPLPEAGVETGSLLPPLDAAKPPEDGAADATDRGEPGDSDADGNAGPLDGG